MGMQIDFVSYLLISSAAYVAASNNYEGYKIYDLNPKNDFEKAFLHDLSSNGDYDFFTLPRLIGHAARVMVKPENQLNFEDNLTTVGVDYSIVNHDVSKSIKEQYAQNQIARSIWNAASGFFEKFQRYDRMSAYLQELAKLHSDRLHLYTVGLSYERRPINAVVITNGERKSNKKVIFIDAGIHGREWLAPATAFFIINQLAEHNSVYEYLLHDYDWVVLPMVNPDGYEYTHTADRMWRKTRKPVTKSCIGTDGNRNFGFHWGELGSSNDPCLDNFRGTEPFSEPETIIVRDIMLSLRGRTKFYLSLHSFGNYLLYPWGFTEELPETWKDLNEIAQIGAAAIKAATGTRYTVGSSTNMLYEASGGSDDYAFGVAQVPISITMELPAGGNGFDPSPADIHGLVEEAWAGIRAMADRVVLIY